MSIIFLSLLCLNYLQTVTSLQPFLHMDLDYASSPVDIKNLIVLESRIVFQLLKISEQCDTEDNCPLDHVHLQTYTEDFEQTLLRDVGIEIDLFKMLFYRSVIEAHGLGFDASKHPFKIYRTLRRVVKILPKLMNSTVKKTDEVHEIQRLMKVHTLPKVSDLETSIFNILRLNQIFKLSFIEFLKGKLGGIQTKCGLTSEHLVEIGKVASANKMYSQAVDAFAIAFWNAVKEGNNSQKNNSSVPLKDNTRPLFDDIVGDVKLKEMFALLQDAIKQHDEKIQGTIEHEDIRIDSGPLFFDSLLYNISHLNFKYRVPVKLETIIPFADYEEDDVRLQVLKYGYTFEKLCRGEELRTPAQKSRLKCYYSSKSHPEFILKPLKLEVHHEDPLLLQYHDVFTGYEMKMYRDEVKGELRMSRTIQGDTANASLTGIASRYRTSSNAWIEDYWHPTVFKEFLHKIGRILNLDTDKPTGSENIQIAAYSPGGHYVPHTDAIMENSVLDKLDPTEFLRGDRITTFMIYLSDVEEGGGTVFPVINTFVKPKMGSAMMWYNLYQDGSIDRRTLHGGCSVIYGVKWIANKWIRSDDQFKTRKCPALSNPIPTSWPLELHV